VIAIRVTGNGVRDLRWLRLAALAAAGCAGCGWRLSE